MSMLNGTSMVYNVITQSNKFVTGVNINAIGDSRLIDSPGVLSDAPILSSGATYSPSH